MNIHVLVDRYDDFRMKIGAAQSSEQHVPGLPFPPGGHFDEHGEQCYPRRDIHVVNVAVTLHVPQAIKQGSFHRHGNQDLMVREQGGLHVPIDRVFAVRNGCNLPDGSRALRALTVAGKFTEGSFLLADVRTDDAFNDNFRVCRDLEIDCLAPDHLDRFA